MKRRTVLIGTTALCGCSMARGDPTAASAPGSRGFTSPMNSPIPTRPSGGVVSMQPSIGPLVPAGSWCGSEMPAAVGGVAPRAYGLKATGWRGKSEFTWSFAGSVPGIPSAQDTINVILLAWNRWGMAAPLLRYRRVASDADIAIGVAPLPGTAVGRTSPDGRTITINANSTWSQTGLQWVTPGSTGSPLSLLHVMTHELGHALGLLHSTDNQAVMNPVVNNVESLATDDYDGIRALYGWPGQRPLPFGTEQAPSMAVCGDRLAMVWRGQGRNRNIWISTTRDGENWSPQRSLDDVATIGSPAVAYGNGRLWLVWRGTDGDQRLYYKSTTDFFDRDRPPQRWFEGGGASSHGPRIALINRVPTAVWKGVDDDPSIWMSQFVAGRWLPQRPIGGIASAAAPAICEDFTGGIRLVWRGVHGDERLWTTSGSAAGTSWRPQAVVQWPILGNGSSAPVGFGTAGSAAGPALASHRSPATLGGPGELVIHAAWRGIDGDQAIWFSRLALEPVGGNPSWSAQARIPNVGSSQPPALARFGNGIHVAWKGVEGDTRLYGVVS